MNSRIDRVREAISENGVDALLIKSKTMKRYLGTLTGSGCKLLILPDRAYLVLDGRYVNEAREKERDLELVEHAQGESYLAYVGDLLERDGCKSLAVEAEEVSVAEYERMSGLGVRIDLWDEQIPGIRMRKDPDEIAAVRRAVNITDQIYDDVVSQLHIGMSEYEISALLQYHAIRAGAQQMSFETIVGTGPRTAMPHCRPTARRVHAHEPILMDFGIQYENYQSDMTRVCFIGEPTPELRNIYETVLEAQLAGISAMRPGNRGREVDAAARSVIERAGYGEYFTHGLGHGIGVDDGTEFPLLRPSSEMVLDEHMIMSCEPGVYVPGIGGVRIEDDVLIEGGKGCPLNNTPKELRILSERG